MKHIITTAFILALTACYPVHAKQLIGKEAEKIWVNGEIISTEQNGQRLDAFIRHKKNFYRCTAQPDKQDYFKLVVFCYNGD